MAAAAGASFLVAGPAGAAETRPASAAAQDGEIRDDFNGDGYADLVIGSPLAAAMGGPNPQRGLVVAYGSRWGILPSRAAVLAPGTNGLPAGEEDTRLGEQITSGDLDGDGYADLVVTSRMREVSERNRGTVTVMWGGPRGLAYGGTTLSNPTPEPYSTYFGVDVEVGDFDGDGRPQLAVLGYRSLWIYEDGFSRTGPAPASRALPVIPNEQPGESAYGLTAGDFTGAGHEDLVVRGVTAPDDWGEGWLLLVPGGPEVGTSSERLRTTGMVVLDFDTGDLNGDGYADLVAGEPWEAAGASQADGRLMLQYGGPQGLGPASRIDYETPGVPGDFEFDVLGSSVAVGDSDGDGYDDVAAGSPDRRVNSSYAAGEVLLLPGSANGVTGAGTRAITEDTTGVPGVSGANVHFGTDVDLLDTDGSGTADLAVSGPGENFVDGIRNEGAIWVLRRPTTGAPIGTGRLLSAESFGLPHAPWGFGPQFGD